MQIYYDFAGFENKKQKLRNYRKKRLLVTEQSKELCTYYISNNHSSYFGFIDDRKHQSHYK